MRPVACAAGRHGALLHAALYLAADPTDEDVDPTDEKDVYRDDPHPEQRRTPTRAPQTSSAHDSDALPCPTPRRSLPSAMLKSPRTA
jgi:hypothetical protein